MSVVRLEDLLEDRRRAPFYDLLGGLADNLLTNSSHVSPFVECARCGNAFWLRGVSSCEQCGREFEVKFVGSEDDGKVIRADAHVTGLRKARGGIDHWYFTGEDWSVAEFLTQMLRLQPEVLLAPWLRTLGIPVQADSELETVLCWPRFQFGPKTIQPDVALGFTKDVVLIEFKRPDAGQTSGEQVAGQYCFAAHAGQQLRREWHVILVPGRAKQTKSHGHYVQSAQAAVAQAAQKWSIPANTTALMDQLPKRLHVVAWEDLLRLSTATICATVPDSWTRRQALCKLRYFQSRRAELKLLDSADAQ